MIAAKYLKEKKGMLIKFFFLFLLIVQGISIFLLNLLQTEHFLFSDNTLAIRHGIEMWRHGIFLDGFNYYSTLEIDNAAFFAIPLYFLTGNLGLSLGIIHILLYILSVFLICSIFKNAGYGTVYGYVASFFLFSPYVISGLDWGNMMFVTVGQYEFRVIVMLSVTNLMLLALNKKENFKKNIYLLILNCLLCFWTSLSCGNYVLLMIVLPICLSFIYINAISDKLQINKYAILVLISSIVFCLVAMMIRDKEIGETSRANLALLTADTFTANLLNCITGFFMLFGGLTQNPYTPIFTSDGIVRICKFVFISICLVVTYLKLKKLKKDDYLHYMFVFIAGVNLLVMALSVTRYGAEIFEYRYHIVWGAMLLLVVVASSDSIKYVYLRYLLVLGVLAISILINYKGFYVIFDKSEALVTEKEIIQVADENDLDIIYFYNMPSEAAAIRVLDYEKNCMSVTYVVDHVFTSSENYFREYYIPYDYDGEHLFVCKPEYWETVPKYIQDTYSKITTVNGLDVYVGEVNLWIE